MPRYSTSRRLSSGGTGIVVAIALFIHSEYGYSVPKPIGVSVDAPIDVQFVFHGWPVRYKFEIKGIDGWTYISWDGSSSHGLRGIPDSIPWGIVDPTKLIAWKFNTTIWFVLVVATVCFSSRPILEDWKLRKFSIFHIELVITYIAVLVYLISRETFTIFHVPIAFGLTCFFLEIVHGILFCTNFLFKKEP